MDQMWSINRKAKRQRPHPAKPVIISSRQTKNRLTRRQASKPPLTRPDSFAYPCRTPQATAGFFYRAATASVLSRPFYRQPISIRFQAWKSRSGSHHEPMDLYRGLDGLRSGCRADYAKRGRGNRTDRQACAENGMPEMRLDFAVPARDTGEHETRSGGEQEVTGYLKLDRSGFILLMTVTNLLATLLDGLIFLYAPMALAILLSVFITGLANAIVAYL